MLSDTGTLMLGAGDTQGVQGGAPVPGLQGPGDLELADGLPGQALRQGRERDGVLRHQGEIGTLPYFPRAAGLLSYAPQVRRGNGPIYSPAGNRVVSLFLLRLLLPVKLMSHHARVRYCFHETSWKQCSTGAAAQGGRFLDGSGMAADADCPPLGNHPPQRGSVDSGASATRSRSVKSQAIPGPSSKALRAAETVLGELPPEGGGRLWLRHGPLDLSKDRGVDSPSLRGELPRRRRSSADERPGFFPLKSLCAEPRNGMKRQSVGGSRTTGPGSSVGRRGPARTWCSSMKQASCCTRCSAGHGHRKGIRRPCRLGLVTGIESRPLGGCRSPRAGGIWAGTCNTTWPSGFAKRKSSPSSATCGVIWGGRLLVVWDHLGAHQGRQLRDWLRHGQRIHLEFFPSYAPELNPNEYGWSYLKTGALANFCPDAVEDLHARVLVAAQDAASQQRLLQGFVAGSKLPIILNRSMRH